MLGIWQFTIFSDTASHNSFLSTVTGWHQHKSENRELLKKSKAGVHVVRRELIPSPKENKHSGNPFKATKLRKKGISKPTRAPIPNQTNKKLHWPDGNWAYVKLWNERDGLASNGWGWNRANGNFWNHDQVQLVEMPLIQRVGIGYQMPPRGCML